MGTITNCFWNTQTSGQNTSSGGTGKTGTQMQTAKTFLDAGWDFRGRTGNGTTTFGGFSKGKTIRVCGGNCPNVYECCRADRGGF